ncbi:MAG: hypothetical protein KTM48_03845 [Wolbachia endosymbiont of Pissodes strobi]|nr:hypothetical protein [Wolbachia endosymbiont of Pissodes strobi]
MASPTPASLSLSLSLSLSPPSDNVLHSQFSSGVLVAYPVMQCDPFYCS